MATGLDAFVHAVEAVPVSGGTNGRRSRRCGPSVWSSSTCPCGRSRETTSGRGRAMQEAAYLAGTAIDGCGTGIAHAIGHALGQLYHVPHGVAVAIGLEAALAWNVEGAPAAFTGVAAALGTGVAEVADEYRRSVASSGFAGVVAGLPESRPRRRRPSAEAMVAEENLPMVPQQLPAGVRPGTARAWPLARRRWWGDRAMLVSTIVRGSTSPTTVCPLEPAVPGLVGPAASHPLPGHHRAGAPTPTGASASARATRCTASPTSSTTSSDRDPLDLERHHAVLSNIDFHAGRPWPMDVALWDLEGQIEQRPVWHLLGGRSGRVRVLRVERRAPARRGHGGGGSARSGARLSGVEGPLRAARAGGRPGGDQGGPRRDRRHARAHGRLQPGLAHALGHARPPGRWTTPRWWPRRSDAESVYWMEEPLHRGDYAGHVELRRRVAIRIAGGEMTREPYEFDELLERGLPRRVPARLRL